MVRFSLIFFGLALAGLLASAAVRADAGTKSRFLRLNVEESGLYEFCLSYEDARIERDARRHAVEGGLSLQDYLQIAPNTRCYKNTISFIPLEPEPRLDGVGYVYKASSYGPYDCPGKANGQRCSIGTGTTTFIKAQLLYGKMRFPVYVALTNAQLAAGN